MTTKEESMFDALATFLLRWADLWDCSSSSQRAYLELMVQSINPWRVRNRWLTDASQIVDDYLRSPAFLEVMRHGVRAMTLGARRPVPNFSVLSELYRRIS